jgi:hypothetical protein
MLNVMAAGPPLRFVTVKYSVSPRGESPFSPNVSVYRKERVESKTASEIIPATDGPGGVA